MLCFCIWGWLSMVASGVANVRELLMLDGETVRVNWIPPYQYPTASPSRRSTDPGDDPTTPSHPPPYLLAPSRPNQCLLWLDLAALPSSGVRR